MVIKFINKLFVPFFMVLDNLYEIIRKISGQKYKGIIIIGPPGAGKDTQADLLQPYGYFNFSSGQMFSDLDRSTDIGNKVASIIDEGDLVPDDLTIKLFLQTLRNYIRDGDYNPRSETLVLNGIPRTVEQVEPVREIVDVLQIIYLQVSRDICAARIAERYREQGRPEDAPNLFDKRYFDFMELTFPILDNYIPVVIPGRGTKQEVHEKIKEALNIHQA